MLILWHSPHRSTLTCCSAFGSSAENNLMNGPPPQCMQRPQPFELSSVEPIRSAPITFRILIGRERIPRGCVRHGLESRFDFSQAAARFTTLTTVNLKVAHLRSAVCRFLCGFYVPLIGYRHTSTSVNFVYNS